MDLKASPRLLTLVGKFHVNSNKSLYESLRLVPESQAIPGYRLVR